jgi:hypothetical protein
LVFAEAPDRRRYSVLHRPFVSFFEGLKAKYTSRIWEFDSQSSELLGQAFEKLTRRPTRNTADSLSRSFFEIDAGLVARALGGHVPV